MVDRSGQRDWSELVTTAPHDIPGEPIRKYLPVGGRHAPMLQQIIAESEVSLAGHEINQTRAEMGELPATHFWPWGQGQRPSMPAFEEKYGLKGAMITAVDLLAGISSFIGWDRLDVPGQTSYHDNDYAAAGEYGIDALDDYDVVCIHIEAPDEAGHAADPATKVAAVGGHRRARGGSGARRAGRTLRPGGPHRLVRLVRRRDVRLADAGAARSLHAGEHPQARPDARAVSDGRRKREKRVAAHLQ